jgi:signal transduction histidine kinase
MHLTFAAAVLLLFLSAFAAYSTVTRLLDAEAWVSHTRDVQLALKDLGNLSARAGRARTQYVDSGDPSFLQDYQTAANDAASGLKHLRLLIVDNPAQLDNLQHLEVLTHRRLDLLKQSVLLKQSGPLEAQAQQQLRQQILDASTEADDLLQKMQDREEQFLDKRKQRSEYLFRITGLILCGAFFVSLTLLFFHYRLLNTELAAREQAEASLRTLSARLLELQDQERRRFSRELHDSLGQYLVGVKMNLAMAANSAPSNSHIAEAVALLDQAISETRTISHLLHPPLLDETGFASAARWYVDGFTKRSGIQTSLDLPENLDRLSTSLELALFRVLQESLTNVHRHSQSPRADVTLKVSGSEVMLRIRDYGKGMPPDVLSRFRRRRAHGGVGLAGMRERIRELGGQLEMDSDERGTQVLATLPRFEAKGSPQTYAAD